MGAEAAGLRAGARTVRINDRNFHVSWESGVEGPRNQGEHATVTYEGDGEQHTAVLEPKQSEDGTWLLGFRGSGVRTKGNVFQTIGYSAYEVKYWISYTLQCLRMLVGGQVGADDISGPVGIVNAIGETYETSRQDGAFYVWLNMLNISILLSANLGVMNLLPLPALDGGRLVFLFLEVIRSGKKLGRKREAWAISGA